jgi:hypothetical protein
MTQEMAKSKFKTVEGALEILRARGFDLIEKPERPQPRMPSDITMLSGEELSRLLSDFSAWLGYALSQVAFADVERTLADNRYKQLLGEKVENMRDVDEKVVYKELEQRAGVDIKVLEAKKAAAEYESLYRLLKGIAESFDKCGFSCSREQSRRESGMRAEGRSYHAGNGRGHTGEDWR